MVEIFLKIVTMSLTSSYVVLVVIALRFLLKKTPKIFSYAMWGVVLFRLVCPFSFKSVISLIPKATSTINPPIINSNIQNNTTQFIPPSPISGVTQNVSQNTNPIEIVMQILSILWLIGILVLIIYSAISYIKLKKGLHNAQNINANIYESNEIKTPFVIGIIKPKIYLPVGLTKEEIAYILKHEQTHIKRFDYIIKPIYFLAVAIHWFNPLAWISFVLMSKDMEMSCDEAVIKKLGNDIKKEYSTSLLSLAPTKKFINGSPLAFGESDAGSRIKNVLNYKKPAFWVIALSIVVVAVIAIGLMTNPIKNGFDGSEVGNDSSYVLMFDLLSVKKTHKLTLLKDDVLDITFTVEEGKINYDIMDENEVIIYKNDNRTQSDSFQVTVPHDGVYTINVAGENANGMVKTVVEGYTPPPDTKTSTILQAFAEELAASFSIDNDMVTLTIPKKPDLDLSMNIMVYGSQKMGDGEMSYHAFENENADQSWKFGETYTDMQKTDSFVTCSISVNVSNGFTPPTEITVERELPKDVTTIRKAPNYVSSGEEISPIDIKDKVMASAKLATDHDLQLVLVDGKQFLGESVGYGGGTDLMNFEGEYELQVLKDGKLISKIENKDLLAISLNDTTLNFNNEFDFAFEDYNRDGDIDFTLGQFAGSNGYLYNIFSIDMNGRIRKLDVNGDLWAASHDFSAKFKKASSTSFEFQKYDNAKGESLTYTATWNGKSFDLSPKDLSVPSPYDFVKTIHDSMIIKDGVAEVTIPKVFPKGLTVQNLSVDFSIFYPYHSGVTPSDHLFYDIENAVPKKWVAGETYTEKLSDSIVDGTEIFREATLVKDGKLSSAAFTKKSYPLRDDSFTPKAATMKNEVHFTDKYNDTFCASMFLPVGWQFKINPQSTQLANTFDIFDSENKKVGSLFYNNFKLYPDTTEENYYRSVYNDLMLGSVASWDNEYKVISKTDTTYIETCKPFVITSNGGLDPKTTYSKGILSHDRNLLKYVGINLDDNAVDDELWLKMAKSIKLWQY